MKQRTPGVVRAVYPSVEDVEMEFQHSWDRVLEEVVKQREILEEVKSLVPDGVSGAMREIFDRMAEGLMDYASGICVIVYLARHPMGTLEGFVDFIEDEACKDEEDAGSVIRDEDWDRIRRIWTEVAGSRR